jgi:hypothetical protein
LPADKSLPFFGHCFGQGCKANERGGGDSWLTPSAARTLARASRGYARYSRGPCFSGDDGTLACLWVSSDAVTAEQVVVLPCRECSKRKDNVYSSLDTNGKVSADLSAGHCRVRAMPSLGSYTGSVFWRFGCGRTVSNRWYSITLSRRSPQLRHLKSSSRHSSS